MLRLFITLATLACVYVQYGRAAEFMVRCESWDYKRKSCSVPGGIRGVQITVQRSRSTCKKGSTWNFDSSKIWVNKGCMGDFWVKTSGSSTRSLIENWGSRQRVHKNRPPNPKFFKTKKVSSTIHIRRPGVYDYRNVLHVWNGRGSCNSQKESQPPILRVSASNVVIKNFAYKNAPDGMHVKGGSRGSPIRNVRLENVYGYACEDALTFNHLDGVKVYHSTFMQNPNNNYADKIGQLATAKNILVENTRFIGRARSIRLKAGSSIKIRYSAFYDCATAVKADSCYYNGYPSKSVRIESYKNIFKNCQNCFDKHGSISINRSKDSYGSCKRERKLEYNSEYCKKQMHS